MNRVAVFTFESHYDAIKAKKEFEKNVSTASFFSEKHLSLSPTPRLVSSTCATSILGDEKVIAILCNNKSSFTSIPGLEGIYIINGKQKEVIYER